MVVGWVRPGRNQYRPYQWRDGRGAFLSTEEGKALGINNKGVIVGEVYRDKSFHACLWKDGKALDLNALIPKNSGWTLYDATGINDKGQIIGTGKFDKDTLSAFLLTPK